MLIGEVAAQSGISTRMLRHYDRIGLVSPSQRSPNGYRKYSDDDVRTLFHVEGLRSLGLSLQEVAEVLEDLSFSPANLVEQLVTRSRKRLAHEEELLAKLSQVQASEPAKWSDVIRTIGLLRGLKDADSSSRLKLALALGPDDDRDAAALAEAVLREDDPNAAGALQWALARSGDAAVPILAQALDSADPERAGRAMAALTKIATPKADEVLAGAADHPDPTVRARATLVRGRLGHTDAIGPLVTLVAHGREDIEASDVLTVLATDHGRADVVVRGIFKALERADTKARQRLTTALADIPGAEAFGELVRLVDDEDDVVALTATSVLRSRPPGF